MEEKRKYIVSACLLGENCKYNGGNNLDEELVELLKNKEVVPVCPEKLGGLEIPREPAEILWGTGEQALNGKARVITKNKRDVSAYFINGAYKTYEMAKKNGANYAIMKENSPSCGSGEIYDGTFSKHLVSGDGVTVALLKANGIKIITKEDLKNI